jgi:serine phosphatase RsbU (regulator of sigma subunit)
VLITGVVIVVGVLVSVSLSLTAWSLNQHSEHRLLKVQTQQAAAVVASSILGISGPLTTALQTAEATNGNVEQFQRFMSTYTGAGQLFVSASLWRSAGSSPSPVATVGAAPTLTAASSRATAFIEQALHSPTFVVTSIHGTGLEHIGYAIANSKDPSFVVYAERAIPADREVPVESNPAFADLNYATYLGPTTAANLATTDVPNSALPLTGHTDRQVVPFGNTTLTLVTAPRGQLGDALASQLVWIFLIGGALLTMAAAGASDQLVRNRRAAERTAQTISGLYDELDGLYGKQRTIAETLQHALLPAYNPPLPGLESASRYVAGAEGVDIGGDWYSLIALDDDHFGFAVGDVSGRGISAATIMARLRFTIRAYLLEGHPPAAVLEMCSRQIDYGDDGHFATVLVGVADLTTRQITLANAGHLNPLIVSETQSRYVETDVGVPLGVLAGPYPSTTVTVPAGSAMVMFTDGLVERRGEGIDVGLDRLARTATGPARALDDLLTHLLTELTQNQSEDDVAILAFRWHVGGGDQ